MKPTIHATEDYLAKVLPKTDPLKGVKVEFTHFNTELDYSKTVPGYLELKGRGVDMMLILEKADGSVRCTSRSRLSEPSMPIAQDFGQI